jgi:cytochrome c-type biogenesis protein
MLCSNGGGSVGLLAAAFAGLVSFLSPCVLPLVPGYLSAVAGVKPGDLERSSAKRVLGPSLLFVASFSAIFIIVFGLPATAIGNLLNDHRATFETIAGAIIIALGLFFVLSTRITALNREWHVEGLMARAGRGGPLVAGAAFAVAWTPCIGPTLGAITTLAAASGSEGHGVLLLAVYSAGLAIPFVVTALFFGYMTSAFDVVKRHYGVIVLAGGVLLVALGVLMVSGQFTQINQTLSGIDFGSC